jgi:hypothetical protein
MASLFDTLRNKFGAGAPQGGIPDNLGVDGMGNTIPNFAPTPLAAPQIPGSTPPNPWQNRVVAAVDGFAKQQQQRPQNLGFPSAPSAQPMPLQPFQQLQTNIHPGAPPQQPVQIAQMQTPTPPQPQQFQGGPGGIQQQQRGMIWPFLQR